MKVTPIIALERLFTTPVLQAEWFEESFLSHVSAPQIEGIIQDLLNSFGAYQALVAEDDSYLIQFERGRVSTQIRLDDTGQILYLWFQPNSDSITPDQAIEVLQELPGQTNLLILEDTSVLASHNADQALAVGSAFKLAVLAALRTQIDQGSSSWRDVVELQPQHKSLPSGFLQTWFDGAFLTVQTLATLMISQSDNTATDTLIHWVGKAAIETLTTWNRPFLSTREAFALKNPENEALLKQYLASDQHQRQQLLLDLATAPLPDPIIFAGKPVTPQVEWFFTPHELCSLITKLSDLPLMSVNPGGGLVDTTKWQKVSFKGGSEPGVLNLTTALYGKDGKHYCVSATWNNFENSVSEMQFYTLYSGVIRGLQAQ
jgi:beta-lactamase class A